MFIHIPKTAGLTVYDLLGIETQPRGPHIPAYAYQWASPEFFRGAFKFAVVRNPWDRLVSAFHFLKTSQFDDDRVWSDKRLARYTTFQEFLGALQQPFFRSLVMTQLHFHPQHTFVTDTSGKMIIDKVIYFDGLAAGLRDLRGRLGLDFTDADIPAKNPSSHMDYWRYYDDAGRDLVARMYHKDIELFGFEFHQPCAGGRDKAGRSTPIAVNDQD